MDIWESEIGISLFPWWASYRILQSWADPYRYRESATKSWGSLRSRELSGVWQARAVPPSHSGYSCSHFPPRVRGLWVSPQLPCPCGSSGALIDLNDCHCIGWTAKLLNCFHLLTTLGNCPWSWVIYSSSFWSYILKRSSPEPLEWEHWLQDTRLPEN